jgi:hypothetical protein
LKLLRLETITFSDATLGNINIVLCYVLWQFHPSSFLERQIARGGGRGGIEGGFF